METIEKIRAEIERLWKEIDSEKDPLAPEQKAGYLFALADIKRFLDTLDEEPVELEKEYIRKDALLEWAKRQMRIHEDRILVAYLTDTQKEGARCSGIKRDMYQVFIDKINSL